MSREFYYLIAGLPDLFLDQDRKDFSIIKLKDEMRELMHPDDYKLVDLIHLEYDNFNFLNAILGRKTEFNPLGSLPQNFFDEIDENIEQLPPYIQGFYRRFKNKEQENTQDESDEFEIDERIEKKPEVLFQEYFYGFMLKQENRFIQQWYGYLRDFNNIQTAISCREQNKDIASELVGGGDIVEALIRSQSPDFGLKRDVDYLESLLQIAELSDIIDRERRLDLLKWEMADELTQFNYFTVERILAFFVKAGIVYRWNKLDAKVGAEMFQKLIKDLRETYQLPKEFAK